MMNVDRLVQEAQRLMEKGEYEEAKKCLKRAASVAPLRADIRGLLEEVLELGPGNRPESNPWRGAATRSTSRPHSNRSPGSSPVLKTFLALIAVVCLVGLGATGFFLAQRWSGSFASMIGGPAGNTSDTLTSSTLPGGSPPAPGLAGVEEKVHAGQYPEALEAIEAALTNPSADKVALNLRRAEVQFEYGKKLRESNKPAEAVAQLEESVKGNPSNADGFYYLGWSYFNKGKSESGAAEKQSYKAAETALNKAVSLNAQMLQAYMLLAQVKILQDKQVEGAKIYKKVIRLDPQSSEAATATQKLDYMGMK